jgi:hypothetical protein
MKPIALFIVSALSALSAPLTAQDAPAKAAPVAAEGRAKLIAAAREIMGAQTYCALVTIDKRLDVLNYKAGTQADPESWRTPSIELGPAAPRP